jgi:hypothetical protein
MIRQAPQPKGVIPVEIVGSSKFGRFPKVSAEKTFNMYVSDNWLMPTPGHIKLGDIDPLQEGRGNFTSVAGKFMLSIIGNGIWRSNENIRKIGRQTPIGDPTEVVAQKVGTIETYTGDVFIDENNASEIAICDKRNIYIYNYSANTVIKAVTPFLPGYVTFQDGRFISPDLLSHQWYLSDLNNGLSWPTTAGYVGELETKADKCKACIRLPGEGNHLFVMGETVTELWNDVGYKLFPYEKITSFNIDYGCLNQATLAASDSFVIWLAINEKSGPTIMYSNGGPAKQISTDGINDELATLKNPREAYGFLWKNSGHLFYQLTFTEDKKTYLCDLITEQFYYLTNALTENHIAKKVVFFAGDYYFISFIDGNLYRLSDEIFLANGELVPRIRVSNTIRSPTNKPFIPGEFGFPIEQGDSATISRVDLNVSYDGGVTFGNIVGHELNPLAERKNRFTEYLLGLANEITIQLRFWGDAHFTCGNGYLKVSP